MSVSCVMMSAYRFSRVMVACFFYVYESRGRNTTGIIIEALMSAIRVTGSWVRREKADTVEGES